MTSDNDHFLQECGPLEEVGMVMEVLDRSFDVVVLRLGVVKRVYCEVSLLCRSPTGQV